MFILALGKRYRVLLKDEKGAWAISYDEPGEPVFFSAPNLDRYQRIQAPPEIVEAEELQKNGLLTRAQRKRYLLIEPLLGDKSFIYDKEKRQVTLKEIADANGTTVRRVKRILFKFWATGQLTAKKTRANTIESADERNFTWAIRTIYFSASKISLQNTYDSMLLARYMTPDGKLSDRIPSFWSFRKFYYDRSFHRLSQRDISRAGLSYYQRNKRPLYGSAMGWRDKLGSYQMDATEADIYLVSRFDKTAVIGRPYVYLAVDTATQLIAGFYVGLDSGESAVIACLRNAVADKVSFCAEYGIIIQPWQWPSHGVPGEIISDKGSEFIGKRMDELCTRFGLEIQSLPPFRPDGKGLVEKCFDMLQSRYKPLLRGKGVIEPDAQERWAVDYREQASLNLNDFTKVLIHCIVYLNSARVMASFEPSPEMAEDKVEPIAAQLWRWYEEHCKSVLMDVDEQEFYLFSLPREQIKVVRRGIECHGLWYSCRDLFEKEIHVGDTVVVAYDREDTSAVYIVKRDNYIEVPIAEAEKQYANMSFAEFDLFQDAQRKNRALLIKNDTEGRIEMIKGIRKVSQGRVPSGSAGIDGQKIKENRKREKEKLS